MLPAILKTDRLLLSQISVEWIDEILEANVGNVVEYFVKFNASGGVHTWINECRAQQERGERLTMAVLSKDNNEFLGLASVLSLNIEPQFSVWIKESAQGCGYGKEAVKCLLDWFKSTYGETQKITYLAEQNNLLSIKLAHSLGMQTVGTRVNSEGKVFQHLQI